MMPSVYSIFLGFICERERIRMARAKGKPAPWTEDKILQSYRFCNINRQHDRVTQWITKQITLDYADHPQLWFNLIIARFINWPPMLLALKQRGVFNEWDENKFLACTSMAKMMDEKVFGAAYIVSTNGLKMDKDVYVATKVLRPLWDHRHLARITQSWACGQWAEWLLSFNGIADFMCNQIVTDYKYSEVLPRVLTKDWTTFCLAGPGTSRGLARLHGRPVDKRIPRLICGSMLKMVRAQVKKDAALRDDKVLVTVSGYYDDMNNLANSFCEFDKYMRARNGEGRPKSGYTTHAEFYDV